MDVLDSSVVGVVQTFGKVLFQVGLKVLVWFFTLKHQWKLDFRWNVFYKKAEIASL